MNSDDEILLLGAGGVVITGLMIFAFVFGRPLAAAFYLGALILILKRAWDLDNPKQ